MEIRANYILVGLFTLLILLGVAGFTLWVGSQDDDIDMAEYDISFTESVKGLYVNGDVLFSGIRVGRVKRITISPVTPGAVTVRVSIAADTPVRENSFAMLDFRGITGVSIIAISGGTADSPLKDVPEGKVGIINYEPSALSAVMTQVPDLLTAATQSVYRIDKFFSRENAASVSTILSSLATVSATLADRSRTIDGILKETEELTVSLNSLAANADQALATDIRTMTKAMSRIVGRIDSTLAALEPGLKRLSTQGLADFRMLMAEMRNMVHIMTRAGHKLDSDPRRFFFGEPVQEYNAP